MTSSSSAAPNGQPSQGLWAFFAPHLAPPVAASVAIPPVFYGFMAKSAQQLGNPIPRLPIKVVLQEGCKAAPTIGVIVGTQMAAQKAVEEVLKSLRKDDAPRASLMLVSSMTVGALSAPALAVFNGQTMGRTALESLRSLSARQTLAIVARETSFLFSLRVSRPLEEWMKDSFGDHRGVGLSSTFAAGAIGSLIGHPADTALTLWQKGRKVENFSQLMRGGPIKALTVGAFSILYKSTKEMIDP